jgi:hypothetical protein
MLREVGRFLRLRFPDDLGWQLEQIANRGVQTTIVFSRGEPGIELLRMQGGSAIKRLGALSTAPTTLSVAAHLERFWRSALALV